jgi:5'-methylthioinosine phosphorylase
MSAPATLALVGGTGLTEVDESVKSISVDTPYGEPSAPISEIRSGPVRFLFLPRHGNPHRYPPHCVNYRANMWALREVGADHVLAVSAVGGVCEPYGPATIAAPDQLIDYTWGRQHTFCDSEHVELEHVDFTHPYEGPLRRSLLIAAREASIDVVNGGCIGVFQGPRLESSAEVEKARRDGCHMAGMTSLPEAGLAREIGLDYAGLAVVANWGAGVTGELLSEEDIAETLKEPMMRVRTLLNALLKVLQNGYDNNE